MRNINRRESPRIEIQLRCHVTSPALWMRSAMYTENISRGGMLVAWRGDGVSLPVPAVGQIVTVEVELPANHGFGQKCIHCQGTVLRVTDSEQDSPRVALRVNYMDFRSFHDRLRAMETLQPAAHAYMA
jgi:c-di-GMP-binding flagellar brake protein YcgR